MDEEITIHRHTNKAPEYCMLDNEIVDSMHLSLEAKGLFWFLLANPEIRKTNLDILSEHLQDRPEIIAGALTALQAKGLIGLST